VLAQDTTPTSSSTSSIERSSTSQTHSSGGQILSQHIAWNQHEESKTTSDQTGSNHGAQVLIGESVMAIAALIFPDLAQNSAGTGSGAAPGGSAQGSPAQTAPDNQTPGTQPKPGATPGAPGAPGSPTPTPGSAAPPPPKPGNAAPAPETTSPNPGGANPSNRRLGLSPLILRHREAPINQTVPLLQITRLRPATSHLPVISRHNRYEPN
jgi:hypothetical protein